MQQIIQLDGPWAHERDSCLKGGDVTGSRNTASPDNDDKGDKDDVVPELRSPWDFKSSLGIAEKTFKIGFKLNSAAHLVTE